MLEELEQAGDPSPFNLAVVHLGLGDNERALSLLEQAVDRGNFQVLYLKADARFDPLRADPRFAELVARIGW